jgi:hypothetical protein
MVSIVGSGKDLAKNAVWYTMYIYLNNVKNKCTLYEKINHYRIECKIVKKEVFCASFFFPMEKWAL